jgi:predicted RNase H-like HicB family nuclease
MTTRQVIEAVLMTVSALLCAAGAIVIEPWVIGVGGVAATAALVLRMTDADLRKPKAKFTATVEQAGDGTWTAAFAGEHTILGTGVSREAALEKLREGLVGEIAYLKSKGEPLPQSSIELVSIEVAL